MFFFGVYLFTMTLPTKTMLAFIFLMSMVSEKMLKSSAKIFVVKIWLILSELLYSWSEIVDCKHRHQQSPHHFHEPPGSVSVTDTILNFALLFFTNYFSASDVGYANFINVIMNEYFTEYFDRAISLAESLRAGGYSESFVYTTHPWLVSLYLDCPSNLTLTNMSLIVSWPELNS